MGQCQFHAPRGDRDKSDADALKLPVECQDVRMPARRTSKEQAIVTMVSWTTTDQLVER
jgi:hypothetical protein